MKMPPALRCAAAVISNIELRPVVLGFGNVTGADAAGTYFDGLDTAFAKSLDLLKVRIPDGTGFVVGMTHVVSEAGAFAANFTYSRHIVLPPLIAEKKSISVYTLLCKGNLRLI
jgi:hypothetical protein